MAERRGWREEAGDTPISVAVVTAAPSAGPLTAATIGFGKSMTVWKTFWLLSLRYMTSLLGSIGFITLLRSTPAE
jgi:hypothetical protein